MAKRFEHTREEIRQLAIDAAEACILEQGISGINARNIAKSVGYAVGTIYQLFKNMDELILAVNSRTLTDLESSVLKAMHNCPDGSESIRCAALAYVEFAQSHTKRWQALFEHTMADGAAVPEHYQQQRSQLFHLLEKQFALLHPSATEEKIVLEARALWAGVHGICILALSGKLDDEGLKLESIATVLIDHFLGAKGGLA